MQGMNKDNYVGISCHDPGLLEKKRIDIGPLCVRCTQNLDVRLEGGVDDGEETRKEDR